MGNNISRLEKKAKGEKTPFLILFKNALYIQS